MQVKSFSIPWKEERVYSRRNPLIVAAILLLTLIILCLVFVSNMILSDLALEHKWSNGVAIISVGVLLAGTIVVAYTHIYSNYREEIEGKAHNRVIMEDLVHATMPKDSYNNSIRIISERPIFNVQILTETQDSSSVIPSLRDKFYINEIDKIEGENYIQIFPELYGVNERISNFYILYDVINNGARESYKLQSDDKPCKKIQGRFIEIQTYSHIGTPYTAKVNIPHRNINRSFKIHNNGVIGIETLHDFISDIYTSLEADGFGEGDSEEGIFDLGLGDRQQMHHKSQISYSEIGHRLEDFLKTIILPEINYSLALSRKPTVLFSEFTEYKKSTVLSSLRKLQMIYQISLISLPGSIMPLFKCYEGDPWVNLIQWKFSNASHIRDKDLILKKDSGELLRKIIFDLDLVSYRSIEEFKRAAPLLIDRIEVELSPESRKELTSLLSFPQETIDYLRDIGVPENFVPSSNIPEGTVF